MNTQGLWALLLAWLVAGLLAGCASVVHRDVASLSGRLSVRVERSGESTRQLSADFELVGNAHQGWLSLSTRLGSTIARANWTPQSVQLLTRQGSTVYSDLPAMTRELLGEAIPLAAVIDWLYGRPWPGAINQPTHEPNDAGFEQLGWQVELTRFGEGWVTARRLQAPLVTLRARVDRP